MSDQKVFNLALLSRLGQKAGLIAFRLRQHKAEYAAHLNNHLEWRKFFTPGEIISLGLAAAALLLLDMILMMPMYKQMSQVVSTNSDPSQYNWPIAMCVNALAVVTSHQLVKCASNGAFYRWEIWKHSGHDTESGILHLAITRQKRIALFLVSLLFYLGVLCLIIWLRSDLIRGSKNDLEKVELQMSLLGILVALFAVTIGAYLIPLLQLLTQKWHLWQTKNQLNSDLKSVVDLDAYVSKIWFQAGKPNDAPQDVKESLVRHHLRTYDWEYCNPITDTEMVAFATTVYGQLPPALPERKAA